MSKYVKELVIDAMNTRLAGTRDVLVVDPTQLDAISNHQLRNKLRDLGIQILQVKNSLARKAFRDAGIDALGQVLKGPSALVWGSEDVVALARHVAKLAKKTEKLVIKGGVIEGTPLDAEGVDRLSKSPGRPELLGRVLSLIRGPGAHIAGALLGPGGKLAGQVKTIAEKSEGEAAPAA